jgi:hypothetical protein
MSRSGLSELHRRALVHRQRRRDVEQHERSHGVRVVEREAVRDAAAAIVAANEEPVVAEAAHEVAYIERHRALAVRRVIGGTFGFVRVAVAAQIRHHEGIATLQSLGYGMPNRVRLRKPVQQQQRRSTGARRGIIAKVERDAVDAPAFEEKVRGKELGHAEPCFRGSSANTSPRSPA